jgi:hypothetical protein
MLKKNWALTAAVVVAAAPRLLLAADAPAAAPAPAIPGWADTLTAWGLTASGYVAASYYVNSGYPGGSFNPPDGEILGLPIHQFDVQHHTFQLDQAGFQLAYQPKTGFGALIDVMAGEDARILHQAEDGNDNTVDIRQGFIQYASGALTVIAGKYVTLAGAEVINPTLNTNFSRSLLFFASEPLTHTGVRATWAVSDTFSLIGGVNNGWNTTSTSFGSKTGEVGIAWTPNKTFSLTTQAYFGKFSEALPADRTLVDVVATYNVTSALTLILNFDYDNQDNPEPGGKSVSWNGAAFYVNYAFSDQWRTSFRIEYVDDTDGFVSGVQQTFKEATLTVGYDPVKNFELRAEFRYDKAEQNVFLKSQPLTETGPGYADNLSQFALQGVYKFASM